MSILTSVKIIPVAAAFSGTFYLTYRYAGSKNMLVGELFNNPMRAADNDNNSSAYSSLIVCLITDGAKKGSDCKRKGEEGENTTHARVIGKHPHMEMYPDLKKIYLDTLEGEELKKDKILPKVEKWCDQKRAEQVKSLDQRLVWHMVMFCSKNQMMY